MDGCDAGDGLVGRTPYRMYISFKIIKAVSSEFQ